MELNPSLRSQFEALDVETLRSFHGRVLGLLSSSAGEGDSTYAEQVQDIGQTHMDNEGVSGVSGYPSSVQHTLKRQCLASTSTAATSASGHAITDRGSSMPVRSLNSQQLQQRTHETLAERQRLAHELTEQYIKPSQDADGKIGKLVLATQNQNKTCTGAQVQVRPEEFCVRNTIRLPGSESTAASKPNETQSESGQASGQVCQTRGVGRSQRSQDSGILWTCQDAGTLLRSEACLDRLHPRTTTIPPEVVSKLLNELRQLEWPKKRHRAKTVEAERYLVIWRDPGPRDPFKKLFDVIENDLLGQHEALKAIPWTHVAVTKNFVGSPHRDEQDQTWQLVCSLGDFEPGEDGEGGGELCIEGPATSSTDALSLYADDNPGRKEFQTCPLRTLYVINTKNKLMRVDGRFMHFVRRVRDTTTDRFSLVFYSLDERSHTEPMGPVDLTWT
eukprot:TRINITY_DN107147_c0_g1_i1.p1 TRINITY_DN107147_c0_g1~~TRINITY_DN107147_c0_g1_i1.p1  ORF type:complete len:446 (-),score=56.95 TRINITY_DN107147_c0_g1_i1:70-1407(-)